MNTESDQKPRWHLRLYISGNSSRNQKTVSTIDRVCGDHLEGRCRIEVIDLRTDPRAAYEDGILATPALIRKLPGPEKRIIGELTDGEELKRGLEIEDQNDR